MLVVAERNEPGEVRGRRGDDPSKTGKRKRRITCHVQLGSRNEGTDSESAGQDDHVASIQILDVVSDDLEDLNMVLFAEYGRTNVGGSADIGIFSMDDPTKLEYLLSTDFEESHPDLSPDRKWLAYMSNSSGRNEIYVRPFPNVEDGEWQVSTTGGELPIWGPSGAKLYFWGPSHIMAVDIESDGGFSAGTASPLFEHANYLYEPVGNIDLDPNGKRFLMIKNASSTTPYRDRIIVVENWFSELVEAVPTN